MHRRILIKYRVISFIFFLLVPFIAYSFTPLWTFEPLTATNVAVPANSTAIVQYRVTNQTRRLTVLKMMAIKGVSQITSGVGNCRSPFVLKGKSSCILSLRIDGSKLSNPIINGPIVCQRNNINQCYKPSRKDLLHLRQAPPITDATITVTNSPLTLTVNGASGQLTIHNNSTIVSADNIASDFSGTALDGHVTETGNSCASVPPNGNCILTYTPQNTIVPQTNFIIQGSNTNAVTAAIEIESGSSLSSISPNNGTASGGAPVTLTGTGLSGATAVTFDGIAATFVNVVNSTTITAVTPVHSPGVVDVAIDTPVGGATLTDGYTYVATAIGQSARGGTIACLNGGQQNMIAAMVDNSTSIEWGGFGSAVGAGAQSNTDGSNNTQAIVNALGNNGNTAYAAQLCTNFEIDSQGNTPCQVGNACYDDWFLPAVDQLNCLYVNQVAIGGFSTTNSYWASTEFSGFPTFAASYQFFGDGNQGVNNKDSLYYVRCVRAFNP